MPNTTFHVKAVDQQGTVYVNGPIDTLRNGFFELWLPRQRKILLTIQWGGRKAVGTIGTYNTSKTCVTTFQLR